MVNPILVALDIDDLHAAHALAETLYDHVGGFKVGLELLMSEGPQAVATVAELGRPVFADAKLHDIPNTVERAAFQLASSGARWVTAHANGGRAMLEAAVGGMQAGAGGGEAGILAVTVLTSLEDADLMDTGVGVPVAEHAIGLAGLASASDSEGVVCSPFEAGQVKENFPGLVVVTPGIRLPADMDHDQKRTATPTDAIRAGADYLVVGRSITQAEDPVMAVETITSSLSEVL